MLAAASSIGLIKKIEGLSFSIKGENNYFNRKFYSMHLFYYVVTGALYMRILGSFKL